MKLVTYKYMWTLKNDEEKKVYLKYVTEMDEGQKEFIESLKKEIVDLEHFGREYISEIDVEKMGIVFDLLEKSCEDEVIESET